MRIEKNSIDEYDGLCYICVRTWNLGLFFMLKIKLMSVLNKFHAEVEYAYKNYIGMHRMQEP